MGAGIAAALTVMGSAHADTIVQNLEFVPVDVLHTGFYSEEYTSRFNPALGTLTDVSVDITGTITGAPDGSPFMDTIFTDQADHTFSLFCDVFATFGPITPDGVNSPLPRTRPKPRAMRNFSRICILGERFWTPAFLPAILPARSFLPPIR
jgi:hypothetical protein